MLLAFEQALHLGESREDKREQALCRLSHTARRLILLHEAALVFPRNVHV